MHDDTHTLGVHDHHGWYNKSPENDTALIDEGYDRRGRPFDLVQDADEFLSRIDRHYYSVLNYQSPEVLRDAEPCRSTEDGTEWRDRLEAFASKRREEEREREERKKRAVERRDERQAEGADFEDADVTPHYQDVEDAVGDIDVAEVVQRYACDEWDTSNRTRETTSAPSWRQSESGESCAVDNTGDSFADNCVGSEGGGAAKAYALGKGIIHADKKSMDELKGADWWRAVDGLRSEGYDIPVWVPEKGTPKSDGDEYDRTPLWALCKGAVAPGVVDADDLVEEEGDDGGTYRRFPDKESYNAALDALEEAGIEHGRERRTTVDDVADGVTPEDVDLVKADGGYGYVSYGDDGDVHVDEVTNFTLETDARVEYADDGTKMFKLTVVPRDGETYQVVTRRH